MPASDIPAHPMPPDKAKREENLRDILHKLNAGEHVQNRRLQKWLLPDEFTELQSAWESQKEIRKELADKPDAIKRYEDLLKKADFLHSKAEGYSSRGRHNTAKKIFNQAETAYERALEHLDENLNADPWLRTWIDREMDWRDGGTTSIDPDSVPRVITSRSRLKQSSGLAGHTQSKREVKIDVVERALANMNSNTTEGDAFRSWLRNRKMPYGKDSEEH